jgi:hypothetical protein
MSAPQIASEAQTVVPQAMSAPQIASAPQKHKDGLKKYKI